MEYLSAPYVLILLLLSPVVAKFARWMIDPIIQSVHDPPALSYNHTYQSGNQSIEQPNKQSDEQSINHFPKLLADEPTIDLSIIIPSYNEEERLPIMLQATLDHLLARSKPNKPFTFELIVVDDGSKDSTTKTALEFARKHLSNQSNNQSNNCEIRVLTLVKNQGKGGAVQQGMLHARGRSLLMADADGATDIRDLDKLEDVLQKIVTKDGHGIAIGSRAHLAEAAAAERAWYRNILTRGFHVLVSNLGGVHSIKDTQCGFKLFTRNTAKRIFAIQHLRRWCFDVEVLYVAQTLHIPVSEVSVRWREVPGSKINLIESSAMMGRDLLIIRFAYATGLWKMTMPDTTNSTHQSINQSIKQSNKQSITVESNKRE